MTVGDAGGETGRCRLVPDAESGLLGKVPNLTLGKSGLQQRGSYMMANCRLLTRTEVALIVQIHSVGYGSEAMFAGELLHEVEEFVLAVKTAQAVIPNV